MFQPSEGIEAVAPPRTVGAPATSGGRSQNERVTVLLISGSEEDHVRMDHLFHSTNWTLYHATRYHEAVEIMRRNPIAIVITEAALEDGASWRDVLTAECQDCRPRVLVAGDPGDRNLWIEILDLGAYDLLAKPFDRNELVRLVSLAWFHWKEDRKNSLPVGAA